MPTKILVLTILFAGCSLGQAIAAPIEDQLFGIRLGSDSATIERVHKGLYVHIGNRGVNALLYSNPTASASALAAWRFPPRPEFVATPVEQIFRHAAQPWRSVRSLPVAAGKPRHDTPARGGGRAPHCAQGRMALQRR